LPNTNGGTQQRERQIPLGPGERRPELLKGTYCLLLLGLEHIDIGLRRIETGARALDGGYCLIATGERFFQRLAAGKILRSERLLALEL